MSYQDILCPECGGPMTSRKNRTTGQRFWGCNDYPACKGTRNVMGEAPSPRAVDEDEDLPSQQWANRDKRRWDA